MSDLSVGPADMQHEINASVLQRFWDALIAGRDKEAAQAYRDDAILRAPQGGTNIAGRHDIAAHGLLEPDERLLKVNSIIGDGEMWVSECEALWHGQMMLLVSVAEMYDGKIARETRYRVPKHEGSSSLAAR